MEKRFLEDAIPMRDFDDLGLGLTHIANKIFNKSYKSNVDRLRVLKYLILNLYDAFNQGRAKFLSRNKNNYRRITRYGTVGARIVLGVLDGLIRDEYVEEYKGFYDRQSRRG
ncbi:MAG: hypothetical protein GY861_26850, partial [bacterium]|nr:hypothetical protein [bacterium]